MTYYTYTTTPAGPVLLVGDEVALHAIYWTVYRHTPAPKAEWIEDAKKFEDILAQIDQYFNGERQTFNIAIAAAGTPFQKSVWQELAKIGYGETRSYQQVANAIGLPQAVRAVGAAIGRNPISIVVPCHRVIASNGKLTGFAGGIESKRMLLEHEKRQSEPQLTLI